MAIRVLSFDFDGCLFHTQYCKSADKTDESVIYYNRFLLDTLRKHQDSFEKTFVLVGSSRQSKFLDECNSEKNKTLSCFKAIQKVNEYLNATLDTFLMADVFSNLKDGTSFENAIDPDFDGEYSDYLLDTSKVILTYAQVHRMAALHPDEQIEFRFYDDLPELLLSLWYYYEANPQFLPKNVSLTFCHYDGKQTALNSYFLQGTGEIDLNYKETVKDLATRAGGDLEADIQFQKIAVCSPGKPVLLPQPKIPASSLRNPGLFQPVTEVTQKTPASVQLEA